MCALLVSTSVWRVVPLRKGIGKRLILVVDTPLPPPSMTTKHTILIVGAGVFGLSTALELHNRGYSVSVVDADRVPAELAASTDISKLVRADYGDDEFYFDLMEESFKVWDQWNKEWKEDLYHQDGILALSRSFKEGNFIYETFNTLKKRKYPVEELDRSAISKRYPAWNSTIWNRGYFNTLAGWAESGRVVTKLAEKLRSLGVQIDQLAASEVLRSGNKITGIKFQDGSVRTADTYVIAAGASTAMLLPHLQAAMVASGQPVFHFTPPPKQAHLFHSSQFPPFFSDITETGYYGFPPHPSDGRIKIGHHGTGYPISWPITAAKVKETWDRVVNIETARIRKFLTQSIPALAEAPIIFTRLCLYCDTKDTDFWINRDPNFSNLVVSAGGSGHGFKFTPVIGKITADALEGKQNRFLERFKYRTFDSNVVAKEQARCRTADLTLQSAL